jgi:hypothetical protein
VKRIYVASSWKCWQQELVVQCLQALGNDVYDFKKDGFSWKEVMPRWDGNTVHEDEYLEALGHPRAIEGYNRDYDHLRRADITILVLPCGRSAHLELGMAVGMHQRTAIYLDGEMNEGQVTPDLMYKMVDHIAPNMHSLLEWVGHAEKK